MKYIFLLSTLLFTTVSRAGTLDQINIDVWGYEDSTIQKYSEGVCLIDFHPISTEYRPIKSVKNSRELSDAKYRFTLVEEVYSSKEESKVRLGYIEKPTSSNSLISKSCNLREGFFVGNTVYFVHTDVGVFTREMKAIFALLRKSLKLEPSPS